MAKLYTPDIPGATEKECGNYLDHDLPKAKEYAVKMQKVLSNWRISDLNYKE